MIYIGIIIITLVMCNLYFPIHQKQKKLNRRLSDTQKDNRNQIAAGRVCVLVYIRNAYTLITRDLAITNVCGGH